MIDLPIDLGAHVCVALSDGTVRCWGDEAKKKTGDAPAPHDVPVSVSGITTATNVAVAGQSSAARLADGTLRWWGELYTPTAPGTVESPVPLTVPGLTSGTSVFLGARRVCAIQGDTTMRCYGVGPLGDGTASDFTPPKAIPALTGVTGATIMDLPKAGFVIVDGTAKAWGTNAFGQLGFGTKTEQLTPTATFAFATQISFQNAHTCARLATGGVRCAGLNDLGQLGLGMTSSTEVTTPTDVPGLSGVRNVCTGQYHSCALLTDKTVRCWGHNSRGMLGDGTTTPRYSPTAVVGITAATRVSCGYDFSCALLEDGTVRCWGNNEAGALGIGKATATSSPVPVSPRW